MFPNRTVTDEAGRVGIYVKPRSRQSTSASLPSSPEHSHSVGHSPGGVGGENVGIAVGIVQFPTVVRLAGGMSSMKVPVNWEGV